jgi:hypothetical protein
MVFYREAGKPGLRGISNTVFGYLISPYLLIENKILQGFPGFKFDNGYGLMWFTNTKKLWFCCRSYKKPPYLLKKIKNAGEDLFQKFTKSDL